MAVLNESFAKFFEEPSREALRNLLKDNFGETQSLDFKGQWPGHASLAKQILGMANTGPGCLIIGVDEKADKTLDPVGLTQLTDKADVQNGLKNYLPTDLMSRVNVLDFSFEAAEYNKIVGKKFQVLLVNYSVEHVPFISSKAGDGLRMAAIYVRKEGLTAEATHDDLQRIINRRIEAAYSTASELDLKKHLEQLRILYAEIPASISTLSMMSINIAFTGLISRTNPNTPKETFEAFIGRMISAKKIAIAKCLGIPDSVMQSHVELQKTVALLEAGGKATRAS